MNRLYFMLLLSFCASGELFCQDLQWVRPLEGSYFSGDNESAIEVDDNGNSYTFGILFDPLTDIDPTAGTQIIDNTPQSPTPHCSLFLTKLDTAGNFVWAKTFGSLFDARDRVIDIEIGTDGNIYLLADISEQTTFYQKFITIFKIDSQGNIMMIKKITNLNSPNQYDIYSSSSLALDNQNNIFITGSYKYHLMIDPTNSELNFTSGGDSFLLKMDTVGNILWGRTFDVQFLNLNFEMVKINSSGNPVVVVDKGDYPPNWEYGYNIYNIATTDGATLWVKSLQEQHPETFEIDNSNNIVIAGRGGTSQGNTIDVDPSPAVVAASAGPYVLWLTGSGNFLDLKEYSQTSMYYFYYTKIAFDTANNTYITGEFHHSFDADPSPASYMLFYNCGLTPHVRDAFLVKLDGARNFESAFKLGDHDSNCINFYFTDFVVKDDFQYFVGNFSATADFDPSAGTHLLDTEDPFGDRFILKLGSCSTAAPSGDQTQSFCAIENPAVGDLLPNSATVKWYDSATSTSQLTIDTGLTDGQVYYAALQMGDCPESQRLAVTVEIKPTPAPPIAISQDFCQSENAHISQLIAAGQNIRWYATETATDVLPSVSPIMNSTTYYVTQTVGGCESARVAVNVTVSSVTLPSVISPQHFCAPQNATLDQIAITGQDIKWYNGSGGGTQLPGGTPLVTGTYYATQSINGCESFPLPVAVEIHLTAAPTGATNQLFCSSQAATLAAIAAGPTAIAWYNDATSTDPLPESTVLVDGAVYYASQTIDNCESVDRLAVLITLIQTLNAVGYVESLCDNQNDGVENVDLTAYNNDLLTVAANSTFTYYTTLNGAATEEALALIAAPTDHILTSGANIIFVRITSNNGCHQVVQLNLILISNPVIDISDIIDLCENSIVAVSAGSGFDSYNWSTGATTQSIMISEPGNYSVTVSDTHGNTACSSTKNFTVVLSQSPVITSLETHDWTDSENSITVYTAGTGNYEFSIDGSLYQVTNEFSGLQSGPYTIYVRGRCGTVNASTYLLMYPKFFTPNSDGHNDTWAIKFAHLEPGIDVIIIDRYGKLLRQLENAESWDGKLNGENLPATDYWFVVTRANGEVYKGHFSLKR